MAPVMTQALIPDALADLEEFRNRLQPYLDEFIDLKTQSYAHYTQDSLLNSIWNYPRCLVQARGKRIRPYVASLVYQSYADDEDLDKCLSVLVALELFHLFCLVHDDIIDRGRERHAVPTVHRYVTARLSEENRLHDLEHIGNSQAILLGDILFAWSQEAFHSSHDFDYKTLQAAWRFFRLMIDEVVIGEMLDVDMMTRRDTSLDAINKKMLLKTASYTFIRPMQIGAALAGASESCEQFCYDLGLSLGIAFQMQDDLLDLTGTPETTQKTLFTDLREHQHTYFTQFIFEHGTCAQQEKLRQLLGTDLQLHHRDIVLDLFQSSGALAQGRAVIRRHLARAYCLLDSAPMRLEDKTAFYELITLIQGRSF